MVIWQPIQKELSKKNALERKNEKERMNEKVRIRNNEWKTKEKGWTKANKIDGTSRQGKFLSLLRTIQKALQEISYYTRTGFSSPFLQAWYVFLKRFNGLIWKLSTSGDLPVSISSYSKDILFSTDLHQNLTKRHHQIQLIRWYQSGIRINSSLVCYTNPNLISHFTKEFCLQSAHIDQCLRPIWVNILWGNLLNSTL